MQIPLKREMFYSRAKRKHILNATVGRYYRHLVNNQFHRRKWWNNSINVCLTNLMLPRKVSANSIDYVKV